MQPYLFLRNFSVAVLYALFFIGLQFLLFRLGTVSYLPDSVNLLHWDAGWYKSIAERGYNFDINRQSTSGFFYLFPAIWKFAHLGTWGICIVNVIFFACGFGALTTKLKLGVPEQLLWLTFPIIFFAFVPYSEALFFLLASAAILGIVKRRRSLVWVSLFFLSLTRATAIVLIPALLLMELMGNDRKTWKRSVLVCITDHITPLLAGLTIFILIQYYQTGVWFAYFIQQSVRWGRRFTLPEFPLQNMSNPGLLWLGALAVFTSVIATILLLKQVWGWMAYGRTQSKVVSLSLGYLMMALFVILFTNTPTEVTGAFRYIMFNPFFYLFIFHCTHHLLFKKKDYLIVLLMATLIWVLFGYRDIAVFALLNINTAIVFLFMLFANKNLRFRWPGIILALLGLVSQVILYQHFISNAATIVD